ncbi:MAG: sugar kinase [Chloroflexota bacterium]
MARFDVTTIGEGQLRYCVQAGNRLETANQLDVYPTGTEANVVSLLSRLGWKTGWFSALPNSPLGRRFASSLRPAGVDLTAVRWQDNARIATYYVEYAKPPRSTQVYYDRANTAFTNMTIDDVDWEYLLNTRLLHISGLTLPLSDSINEILHTAVSKAKARNIPVSFDMNYRSRIWTPEEAVTAVEPIIKQVNILFFARGDIEIMYGKQENNECLFKLMTEKTDAKNIIISLSGDGLLGFDQQSYYQEPAREVEIIDRIGAGDAMVAGVLHGYLQGNFPKGLRYGTLTGALALSQWGDQLITTAEELDSMVNQTEAKSITR